MEIMVNSDINNQLTSNRVFRLIKLADQMPRSSDVNGPVRYRFRPVKPIIKSEPVHSILVGLFGSV